MAFLPLPYYTSLDINIDEEPNDTLAAIKKGKKAIKI